MPESSLGVQLVEARWSKSNVGQALENSFALSQSFLAIAKAERAVAYGGQLAYGSHCFLVRIPAPDDAPSTEGAGVHISITLLNS